eukprot:353796-Chlamydomonas_euryale.AAC.6
MPSSWRRTRPRRSGDDGTSAAAAPGSALAVLCWLPASVAVAASGQSREQAPRLRNAALRQHAALSQECHAVGSRVGNNAAAAALEPIGRDAGPVGPTMV